MVKLSLRYRHLKSEPEHSERLFGPHVAWLFVLVAALIVQVATPSGGRQLTLCCFLVALGSWAQILRSVIKGRIQARWIGSVAVIVLSACVLFPPATSKDINSYGLYGRMSAEYNQSPYTHLPRKFAADVWFQRTSAYWSDTPSVYGPTFTAISDVVMSGAGQSYLKTRLAFQGIAAVSMLAIVWMLSRRLGWALAWAAGGLNPLLVTFGVNDGHCDVLIGALVLAGVLALDRRHLVKAGIALGLAATIKVSLLPALFGAFVWLWFKDSKRSAVVAGLSGSVVVLAGLAATGGLDSVSALQQASLRHTRFSVWSPVHSLLTDAYGVALPTQSQADSTVSLLASLSVFSVGLVVLWRSRRNTSAVVSVTAILVAYQVLGAYTLSWYAAWSVPALSLTLLSSRSKDKRMLMVAMVHGSWLAIAYLNGYAVTVISVVAIAVAVAVFFAKPQLWRRAWT